MSDARTIFLLTDFGADSYYQGVMKGVIASLDFLPQDAILVIVVDPGVGTDRRILAAAFGERVVIAPDNGVLTSLFRRKDVREVRQVTNPAIPLASISTTFHGRDIFAPAAARLASGMALADFGEIVSDPMMLGRETERKDTVILEADVVHVDSFGNLITDVSRDQWIRNVGSPQFIIEAGNFQIQRISPTFNAVRHGEAVAYFGSAGFLEVGVRGGAAAKIMNIDVGGRILVRKRT